MFRKSKTCETVDELKRYELIIYEFLPRQAAKPSEQGEYSCLLLEDGARRPCTTILWMQHGELASRKIFLNPRRRRKIRRIETRKRSKMDP